MKFKRLFVVLLISFMLLSVPCAYASDSNTDENVNTNLQDVKINNVAKSTIIGVNEIIDMNSPTNIDKDKKSDNIDTEDLKKEIAECESNLSRIHNYFSLRSDKIMQKDSYNIFYREAIKCINFAKMDLENNNIIVAEKSIAIAKKMIRSMESLSGIKSKDLK